MGKLDVKAFGLACGIVWGAAMFLLGVIDIFSSWGKGWTDLMATLYIGYAPTPIGSVIGALWGFFDAGIGGAAVAWLYNKFSSR